MNAWNYHYSCTPHQACKQNFKTLTRYCNPTSCSRSQATNGPLARSRKNSLSPTRTTAIRGRNAVLETSYQRRWTWLKRWFPAPTSCSTLAVEQTPRQCSPRSPRMPPQTDVKSSLSVQASTAVKPSGGTWTSPAYRTPWRESIAVRTRNPTSSWNSSGSSATNLPSWTANPLSSCARNCDAYANR